MYRKIRVVVASLVVMGVCMLSSTGTLSYFTDSDSKTNDFIIGNASTRLTIYADSDGQQEFDVSQLSPLTDKMSIPFYPSAVNDGNIPVYQRFRVAIPIALADVVVINLPTAETTNDGSIECSQTLDNQNVDGNICSNDDYTIIYNSSVRVDDEPTYAVYYIVNNKVLAPGENTSKWPMTGIYFDGISDTNKSAFACEENDNNCIFGINIYTDVIQTTGFTDGAVSAFQNLAETY